MLPVNCPGCGASFRVPPDLLATQMHCRRCDTNFYFDDGGTLKTGKKPVPIVETDAKARYSKSADLGPGLAWGRLPVAVRGGLAAAVIVGLAAGVGFWINRTRLEVPESLTDRVEYTARAILNNDNSRLQAVCAPGSNEQAAEFAVAVRAILEKKGLGPDAMIMVEEQGRDKDHVANLSARFMPPSMNGIVQKAEGATGSGGSGNANKGRGPSKAAVKAVTDRTYELHLVWTKSDGGQWLLDAPQTLQYYQAAASRRTVSRTNGRDAKGN